MKIKAKLGEVMREFYEEGIPHDTKPRCIEFLEKDGLASVIMGMRCSGKTYLSYLRMQTLIQSGIEINRIVHVNFDDDRLRGLTADDLYLIGDLHAEIFPAAARERCWYFLDELQDVEGWETYARRLIDSKKVTLCLTGSSSKLLSREIATQMRGRSLEIEVFPLSFAEFIVFNGWFESCPREPFSSRTSGALRHAATQYLEVGGFPAVQGEVPRVRNRILQVYLDAVVYRDVIERHRIPSTQALRYTLDYIVHNFARKVSARAISGVLKELGISDNRENIADYLHYFADAYLIYPVSLRTDSLARRRTNPDKYYVVDTGLLLALTPKNDAEKGWLLENMVFMALRRGENKIEYYITKDGEEVDFLVTDTVTKRRRLVQVAWELSLIGTKQRELKALVKARVETKVKDCTVVTWDEEDELPDGIRIVPVWKWMLKEGV